MFFKINSTRIQIFYGGMIVVFDRLCELGLVDYVDSYLTTTLVIKVYSVLIDLLDHIKNGTI